MLRGGESEAIVFERFLRNIDWEKVKFSAGGVLSWAVYFKIDPLKFDAHTVVHVLHMHLLHTSKKIVWTTARPLGSKHQRKRRDRHAQSERL